MQDAVTSAAPDAPGMWHTPRGSLHGPRRRIARPFYTGPWACSIETDGTKIRIGAGKLLQALYPLSWTPDLLDVTTAIGALTGTEFILCFKLRCAPFAYAAVNAGQMAGLFAPSVVFSDGTIGDFADQAETVTGASFSTTYILWPVATVTTADGVALSIEQLQRQHIEVPLDRRWSLVDDTITSGSVYHSDLQETHPNSDGTEGFTAYREYMVSRVANGGMY